MTKFIIIVKWGLIVVAIAWAVYSTNAFLFLAKTFPSPGPVKQNTPELIANIQGYAVVFGPLIVAVLFRMIRWPEGSKGNSKRRASN